MKGEFVMKIIIFSSIIGGFLGAYLVNKYYYGCKIKSN